MFVWLFCFVFHVLPYLDSSKVVAEKQSSLQSDFKCFKDYCFRGSGFLLFGEEKGFLGGGGGFSVSFF